MNPYNVVGLFCDDIREEKSGKHTLVGVYGDNLNVPSIPGALSRLGVYIRVHLKPDFEVRDFSLSLHFADGEEVHIGKFDPKLIAAQKAKEEEGNPSPYIGAILRAAAGPVVIKAVGRILAVVTINGEKNIAVGLNVKLKPSTATASSIAAEQPALQSPPAASQS